MSLSEKCPKYYTKKMLNMHVYNFKKQVLQIIICTPPLKILTITHYTERFVCFFFLKSFFSSVCFTCLCLYIHVPVEPEEVKSLEAGLRAAAIYHWTKPPARTNALMLSHLSSLCYKRHNLTEPSLSLHGKPALPSVSSLLDYSTSPTPCLILAQQSSNLNPPFLASHLITTLSLLYHLWLSRKPLMTNSVCSRFLISTGIKLLHLEMATTAWLLYHHHN